MSLDRLLLEQGGFRLLETGGGDRLLETSSAATVTVPNIVGLTQAQGASAVTALGLVFGAITTAYSATFPAGILMSQSPAAGVTASSVGDTVTAIVSLGAQPIAVPNVVGLTAAAAQAALADVGLISGTITNVFDVDYPVGDIASQSPVAGTLVQPGSAVNLGLSVFSLPFDVDATVISQYANSPTIMALVESFGEWFDPSANMASFYSMIWNIDTAEGFGLDILGRILKVSRVVPIPGTSGSFGFDNTDSPPDWENFGGGPFFSGQLAANSFKLNDAPYRTLLLTKALANIVTTTAPALNALITNLFPGRGRCYTIDRGGMSMSYVFEFALSSIEHAILAFSGVLPHPAGVQIDVVVIPTEQGVFGFKEAGATAEPFDFGVFYPG